MKIKLKIIVFVVLIINFSFAYAESNIVKIEAIKSEIYNIIKKQRDKNLFSEESEIKINFIEEKNFESKKYSLNENNTSRVGGLCKINLTFDKFGNIPYAGEDKELMSLTKFKNEIQKDIARKFVALHEQSHCEFTNINEPVKLRNVSENLNQNINFLLKDLEVMNFENSNGGTELNYLGTLNESYADVSAMIVLIIEYGTNNQDLNYVFEAIEAQRYDSYLKKGAEVHNTHMAIRKVVTNENIKKISEIKNKLDFQKIALSIANEGVQSLMTQRKDFLEKSLSRNNFARSVLVNMLKIIKYESLSNIDKKTYQPSMWKEGIDSGLTYTLAQEYLIEVDLSKYNFDNSKKITGKINQDSVAFAIDLICNIPVKNKIVEYTYEKFNKVMTELKKQMYKNQEKFLEVSNSNLMELEK